MHRAAIYTRVSSVQQVDNFSLDAQHRACKDYADANGHRVVKHYQDPGQSARTADRPAFQQMLADAAADTFDVVIVHKLDRFARDVQDLLRIVDQLEEHDVRLVSVSDQIDYATPAGRMQLSILASVGEWYSNNLAAEIKKGLTERVAAGKHISNIPIGYQSVDDALVPDGNAQFVRLIFNLYADGNSLSSISKQLHQRNILSKNGKRIYPAAVRYILRNRVYVGEVRHNGTWYPGEHKPVVPQALFERVQQRLRDVSDNRSRPRKRRAVYPLSGILYCTCGGGHTYTGKYVKKSGRRYYVTQRQDCTSRPRTIPSSEIHHDFETNILAQIQLDDAMIQQIIAERVESDPDNLSLLESEAARERLLDLYQWGEIDRAEYERRSADIDARTTADTGYPDNYEELIDLLSDFTNLWHAATPQERHTLAPHIANKIYIDERNIVAVEPTPLAYEFFTMWRNHHKTIHADTFRLIRPAGAA